MAYITIDVGGTYIKHACSDEQYHLYAQGKVETPRTNQEDFFTVIEKIVHASKETIEGIAISMPGTINEQDGLVIQGGSLTYNANQYVGRQLEERLGIPVSIHNDAKCAAMAELQLGNMRDIKDGIVLVFGTGLGGCVIMNHEIHQGHHFFAGEVSAMIVKDPLVYQRKAALGEQSGIPAFVQKVKEAKQWQDEIDGPLVFAWLQQGDPITSQLFQEYCWNVAIQLYNFQCMFDPQRICIGGGVSAQPLFLQTIQKMVDALYAQLPDFLPRAEVTTCKFYNDSNMIGALCYHMQEQAQKKGNVR